MNLNNLSKLLIVFLLVIVPLSVSAHSGRTDSNGCHTNKKTGEYHCHGTPAVKTAKVEAKTIAKTDYYCLADIYNCSDFFSQEDAQAVYEQCFAERGEDSHDLDRDKDGVACEAIK